jgi:hypothetical protein
MEEPPPAAAAAVILLLFLGAFGHWIGARRSAFACPAEGLPAAKLIVPRLAASPASCSIAWLKHGWLDACAKSSLKRATAHL